MSSNNGDIENELQSVSTRNPSSYKRWSYFICIHVKYVSTTHACFVLNSYIKHWMIEITLYLNWKIDWKIPMLLKEKKILMIDTKNF